MYVHMPKTGGTTMSAVLREHGWTEYGPAHMSTEEARRLFPEATVVCTVRPEKAWHLSWFRHCMAAFELGRRNERVERALLWYGGGRSTVAADVFTGVLDLAWARRRGPHPLEYDHLLKPWRGEVPPADTLYRVAYQRWAGPADVRVDLDDLDDADEVFGLLPGTIRAFGRLNVRGTE